MDRKIDFSFPVFQRLGKKHVGVGRFGMTLIDSFPWRSWVHEEARKATSSQFCSRFQKTVSYAFSPQGLDMTDTTQGQHHNRRHQTPSPHLPDCHVLVQLIRSACMNFL